MSSTHRRLAAAVAEEFDPVVYTSKPTAVVYSSRTRSFFNYDRQNVDFWSYISYKTENQNCRLQQCNENVYILHKAPPSSFKMYDYSL